ncbi:MAG: 7-carboxy-7-deazaguanine synthase QueE, partial [Pseudomonadota bacterium]|nr:7-carboxy-7-deazaguanine synthase QueE [Pseudomonadota bacterium]
LAVKRIFPTLQGEGPYAGQPAVFVRLGGCNLACAFCDTDFEDFSALGLDEIIGEVKRLAEGVRRLVVMTGGEPLRQNIAPLCEALLAKGFKVQIETNGTLWRELPQAVEIVCSPKNTGGGYAPLREDVLPRVNAFKFIISKNDSKYDHVAEVGQSRYGTPVYVQPMDEYDDTRNAENLAHALTLAQTQGYRLSLQLHKILGIES